MAACLCVLAGAVASIGFSKAAKNNQAAQVKQVTEEDKQYAQCLQEKGITMYGTSWCPHCKHQKAEFGELFSYVNYVDCEQQPKICRERKVTGYPTWLLPNGSEVDPGTIKDVAKASGCSLAQATPTVKHASQTTTTETTTQTVETKGDTTDSSNSMDQ